MHEILTQFKLRLFFLDNLTPDSHILVINTNDNILWILGAAIIFIVTIAVFYNLWNEQKFEKTFINIMLSIIFGLIGMYIFLLLLQTFFIFFKYLYNLKYKKITEPEKHVLQ